MDKTINVILKVLFDFALEVWFSIVLCFYVQENLKAKLAVGLV